MHTPHLQSDDDDDDDDDKIESSLDLIHFDHPIKYPTLAVWSAEPVPRIGRPSRLTATFLNNIRYRHSFFFMYILFLYTYIYITLILILKNALPPKLHLCARRISSLDSQWMPARPKKKGDLLSLTAQEIGDSLGLNIFGWFTVIAVLK